MDFIQNEWICPITQMPMKEPVITQDGHTYEKSAILEWFYNSSKSPKTGLLLQSKKLIPNRVLKAVIEKYTSSMQKLRLRYKNDFSQLQQMVQNEIKSKQILVKDLQKCNKQMKFYVPQNFSFYSQNLQENEGKSKVSCKKRKWFDIQQDMSQMIIKIELSQYNMIKSFLKLSRELITPEKQQQLRLKMHQLSLKTQNHLLPQKTQIQHKNLSQKLQINKSRLFQSILAYQDPIMSFQPSQSLLLNPFDYLLQVFESQRQIKARYHKNFDTELSSLEHQRTSIDMLKFFKYDWRNLKSINLMNCEIRDQDWKLFVKNAHKIPNLKEIKIYSNFITTLIPGDLESFSSLQSILFYTYGGWTNPLSQDSKEYLQEFSKNHPQIKILYQL